MAETLLVLYGSQTGNAEAAAISIANQSSKKLSIDARVMQLDDFIYVENAKWPRIIVIVTSSYGVGHAPIGCHRFREFCDTIISSSEDPFLKDVKYALLGLGDSEYKTFFENPTRIDEALRSKGAERIGGIGKADASGSGEEEQGKVIENWISALWPILKKALDSDPPTQTSLELAQAKTYKICSETFPDFPMIVEKRSNSLHFMVSLAILVAFVGIVLNEYGYKLI